MFKMVIIKDPLKLPLKGENAGAHAAAIAGAAGLPYRSGECLSRFSGGLGWGYEIQLSQLNSY
jgi:hypothetical protein